MNIFIIYVYIVHEMFFTCYLSNINFFERLFAMALDELFTVH